MPGRHFSICLGVDSYADRQLGNLSYAASDASTIHQLMQAALGDDRHALLLPEKTNSVELMERLQDFLRDNGVKARDHVMFYFAGHGVYLPRQQEHFLLLSKARVRALRDGDFAGNDVLNIGALLRELDQCPADFALVLDACRTPPGCEHARQHDDSLTDILAGLERRDMTTEPMDLDEPAEAPRPLDTRHMIVVSCEEGGRAHELISLRQGLFAHAFVGWLRDAVLSREPAVLNAGALEALARRMDEAALKAGIATKQRPWTTQPDRHFPLSRPGDETPPPRRAAPGHPPAGDFNDVDAAWCPRVRILGRPQGAGEPRLLLAVSVDPVTVEQFLALTPDGRRMARRTWRRGADAPNVPVTWLTRRECEQWIEALNARLRDALGGGWPAYRLLTRLEWTHACTGGVMRGAGYFIGGVQCSTLTIQDAVFRWSEAETGVYSKTLNPAGPLPVDDPRNMRNAFGLRGMHGNVKELALHDRRRDQSALMGGSFLSGPQYLRAGYFSIETREGPWGDVGFRVARALTDQESAFISEENRHAS